MGELLIAPGVEVGQFVVIEPKQMKRDGTKIRGYEQSDFEDAFKRYLGEEAPPASHDEMQYLYRHLEAVMLATGFLNPDNPRHLMRRLKRLFNRARPDQNEVNILRGILAAIEKDRKVRS